MTAIVRTHVKRHWLKAWAGIVSVALVVAVVLSMMPVGVSFDLGGFLSIGIRQVSADSTPWLGTWAHRVKLTTNSSLIDADLTHFPVTVFLNTGNGETSKVLEELGDNKLKLAFTKDDGTTQLYAEIERWDAIAALAWDSGSLAHYTSNDNLARNLVVDGDYLYGVTAGATSNNFVIYDVSDPDVPVKKSQINLGAEAIDIRKKGNYCYVSFGYGTSAGFKIVDVTNPAAPSVHSTINAGGSTHGMFISGDYLYISLFEAHKFIVYDISNPTSPVKKSELSGTTYFNGCHDVYVDGNYAYVTNYLAGAGQYGIVVVDVSDPTAMSVVAYMEENRQRSYITKKGNYIYAGSHKPDSELIVYDVSTPTSPSLVGRFFGALGAVDIGYWMDWYGDDLLATWWSGTGARLVRIDVSTPSSCNITETVMVGSRHSRCIFVNNSRIWLSSTEGTTSSWNWHIKSLLLEPSAVIHVSRSGWEIASATNTDFYLYYDSTQADNSTYVGVIDSTPGAAVWDSNFKNVCHMVDATTSTVKDSTSNNYDGTKVGANQPVWSIGKLGSAQGFDGSNDYVGLGNVMNLYPITIEAYVRGISTADTHPVNKYGAGSYNGWMMGHSVAWYYVTSSRYVGATSYGAISASEFGHKVFTVDSSGGKGYSNGSLVASTSWAGTAGACTTTQQVKYGQYGEYSAGYFKGIIGEVRISGSARSAAWIKATYNSLNDSLLTYGSEETATPSISNTPSTYDFGTIAVGTTAATTIDYFTITNTGTVAVDVTIQGTDLTGGDDTWTLANDAAPGENIYGLKAGLDGADYTIVVKKAETYNTLKSGLAASATQKWGLKLWMPTTITNYDNQEMSATVTLVASASS